MNRKVQIVRFWLLCIAVLGWMWIQPDAMWALAPIAYFTGQSGCFCCAGATGECPDRCTVVPASMTLVIASVANSGCANCAAFNTTYIMAESALVTCGGFTAFLGLCGHVHLENTVVDWAYHKVGSNTILRCRIAIDCVATPGLDYERYIWEADLGSAPLDCKALVSSTNVPYVSTTTCAAAPNRCNPAPGTITATAS